MRPPHTLSYTPYLFLYFPLLLLLLFYTNFCRYLYILFYHRFIEAYRGIPIPSISLQNILLCVSVYCIQFLNKNSTEELRILPTTYLISNSAYFLSFCSTIHLTFNSAYILRYASSITIANNLHKPYYNSPHICGTAFSYYNPIYKLFLSIVFPFAF